MKSIKETLGEVLGRLAQDTGAARLLVPLWAQVVGTTVAKHAQPLGLLDGVLTVRCDSVAWRDALLGEREAILQRLQDTLGPAKLQSIVFEGP
jgi:predicted nucleic acid-binding Zn ribbon protein